MIERLLNINHLAYDSTDTRAIKYQDEADRMKYTTLKAFEKHLGETDPKHFSDIYAIIGKEAFEVKSATDKLIKALLKAEKNPEFGLKIFNGEKLELDLLLEELNSSSFFSENKLILIEKGEALKKEELVKLETYFLNPNPHIRLIITSPTFNRATNFYKKLEKVAILLDIAEEKSWEKEKTVKEWVFAKIIRENKKIDPDSLNLLIKQVGTDYAALHHEIEKLICFVGEKNAITRQDIEALTTVISRETSWQLFDALFAKNAKKALTIVKGLQQEGLALLPLLRQIRTQFQTDFQICTLLANGESSEAITKEYPYMRGRILDNHIQSAKSYGLNSFKKALIKIDETESKLKNGLLDEDFLAELLIIQLVT